MWPHYMVSVFLISHVLRSSTCENSTGMTSASVWLLSLVLSWGLPSPHTTLSSATVYYVTPHSPNPDCPSGEPCLTINEYAQGNHFDGDDNITLLFLNGEHNLTAREFTIAHKTALEMAPNISHTCQPILTQNRDRIAQKVGSLTENRDIRESWSLQL